MNTVQLSLFNEPAEAIVTAYEQITSAKPAPLKYINFVQELCATMESNTAGSLILAVVPSGLAVDKVCASLAEYLDEAKEHGKGHGREDLTLIEIPHATNLRVQQSLLADTYTRLPASVGHRHAPQFQLEFTSGLSAYTSPRPLDQIRSRLQSRPARYYVIKNGHYLCPVGGNVHDGVNQLRFLAQLSRQSDKTHVIFTTPICACEWLTVDHDFGEISTCWLRPYHRGDTSSYIEFKGVIKGYDAVLPKATDFKLVAHSDEIYAAVWGCIFRFDAWVRRTLISVRARQGEVVSWADFRRNAPSPLEVSRARSEFVEINKMFPPLPEEKVGADQLPDQKPQRTLKPGQRRLGRDPAGHAVDAA